MIFSGPSQRASVSARHWRPQPGPLEMNDGRGGETEGGGGEEGRRGERGRRRRGIRDREEEGKGGEREEMRLGEERRREERGERG